MVTQLIAGTTNIAPAAVQGFASEREPGTLVHPILGRAYPDFTFRPAQLRKGTARLAFLTESAARACESALLTVATVHLVSTDLASGFTFIIPKEGGTFRVALSDTTGASWSVEFPWQEVPG